MYEFTCENCQVDYITSPDWDDECYCETCYLSIFPVPNWYKENKNA